MDIIEILMKYQKIEYVCKFLHLKTAMQNDMKSKISCLNTYCIAFTSNAEKCIIFFLKKIQILFKTFSDHLRY